MIEQSAGPDTSPDTSPDTGPQPRTRLRKGAVGVAGMVFFVLSAQAPLTGVAGTLPIPLGLGNGGAAPAVYLVVGVMVGLFAVGFIAMSRHVTDAGAFYAYVSRGLGRPLGVGASQAAILCYSATQAALYGLYGVVVQGLAQRYLSLDLPWWVWTLATMLLVQALGSLNIELGARLLAVLVVAETSVLLLFAGYELLSGGGPHGLDIAGSFAPSAFFTGAPGVALTFAIGCLLGFESTALYAKEARDPARTVPRATYVSVAAISLFFAFVSWMIVSYYGADRVQGAALDALREGDATSVVLTPLTHTLGGWAGDVTQFLLASSLLAGVVAFHNGINRYFHSLGRAGVLPRGLARTNRHGAPYAASLAQTVLAAVLVVPFAVAGADPVLTLLTWGGGVSVLALMLLYLLTSVSVIVFFRRTRLDERIWHTVLAPLLAIALLCGATVLALRNFTTLVSASGTTALVLELTVVAVFAGGVVLGLLRPGGAEACTYEGSEEP
ncbi:APC family permease [Streptomyces endophyticus]|uniref:APC family permease n=1 Tax=Streptomyces endophyticus TaxID=714166 RepID=A0ABU6FG10_9ACTN|nr:APC family permease [Streptomyces endophyticus]MEB8342403.1 APC family permease [Streptomyces endophyticus]